MEKSNTEKIELEKFVVFNIDDITYALPGNRVREIVIGYKVHYLPFVPTYIRGLINRHGEPYTVVDIKILFNQESLNADKFIIIRDDTDKLSLVITEISQIVNVDKKEVHPITSGEKMLEYFKRSITLNDIEVPILEIDAIIGKIEDDIK